MVTESASYADPSEALENYVSAFALKDTDAIDRLLAPYALVEMPMLRPNRLVGARETRRGHDAIFANLASITLNLGVPACSGPIAMATGVLDTVRNGSPETIAMALVAETTLAGIARLSFYMEARHRRLWSDVAIL